MEIHFKIIGILFMLLALIHIGFPKRFNWAQELKLLSLMNRQMMLVHTMFIGLTVFLMGVLCFLCSAELTTSTFGKKISIGLSVFWLVRLFVQFFGYSTELWKGKTFETWMHIIFSAFWIYICTVFIINVFTPIYD